MDEMGSEQQEPTQATVLDWLKSVLRGEPIPIPQAEEDSERAETRVAEAVASRPRSPARAAAPAAPGLRGISRLSAKQLRLPVALLLAMIAQHNLQARAGQVTVNVLMYLLAGGLVAWALLAGDLQLPHAEVSERGEISSSVRPRLLLAGLFFAILTLLTAGGNRFRPPTVIAWLMTWGLVLAALWQGAAPFSSLPSRLRRWLAKPRIDLRLSSFSLLLLAALALVAFFRFGALSSVPYEMWSDHAEKLLDVRDVLSGQPKIFFERNSGREAIEFYWVAFYVRVLGAGMRFLTLKLVTSTAGFLALPFIYLLGKEIGGRRVGLFALLLAGMAAWPNITSRAGLRMPLNEMAVAPALYFLVRGLRRRDRNSFLLSGAALGLGLHGYTGVRVLPLVLLLGFGLYLLHSESEGARRWTLIGFSGLVIVSLVGFLPLLRVMIDMPEPVLYRTLTRVGTLEKAYDMPPLLQFLKNNLNAMLMFGWDNGEVWIVSVPHRPALGWITGAFFHLGVILTVIDYFRNRRWERALLLLSIPVLLLPSTMALAFPVENPGPNRVTATIVPVFVITGLALDAFYRWAQRLTDGHGHRVAVATVALLLVGVGAINRHLVFDIYAHDQRRDVWNNSEAGAVMAGFANSLGSFEDTYFVAYPHWIDTRLAAIEAGAPLRDYAYWPDAVAELELDPARYHLFLIKPEDTEAMDLLAAMYPRGVLSHVPSAVAGRDFYLYLIPPSDPARTASKEVPDLSHWAPARHLQSR